MASRSSVFNQEGRYQIRTLSNLQRKAKELSSQGSQGKTNTEDSHKVNQIDSSDSFGTSSENSDSDDIDHNKSKPDLIDGSLSQSRSNSWLAKSKIPSKTTTGDRSRNHHHEMRSTSVAPPKQGGWLENNSPKPFNLTRRVSEDDNEADVE